MARKAELRCACRLPERRRVRRKSGRKGLALIDVVCRPLVLLVPYRLGRARVMRRMAEDAYLGGLAGFYLSRGERPEVVLRARDGGKRNSGSGKRDRCPQNPGLYQGLFRLRAFFRIFPIYTPFRFIYRTRKGFFWVLGSKLH